MTICRTRTDHLRRAAAERAAMWAALHASWLLVQAIRIQNARNRARAMRVIAEHHRGN